MDNRALLETGRRAARSGPDYTNGELLDALCDAIERLEKNLHGRDNFIVGKGLWQEFVDSLPRAALKGEGDG